MICNKIISDSNCNTIVQDEEFETGNAYVYILQYNNSEEEQQVFIREKEKEEIKFTIGKDGFYTLCSLIVPTDPTKKYFFKDGTFYKNVETVSSNNEVTTIQERVELEELIEINPSVFNFHTQYYYYFQICKLRKCYINACQDIINKRASLNCDANSISKQDIYKRDLLRSTIDVLKYLVEMQQFKEAQRLLERVTSCNGLCNNYNPCGCGC